MTLFTEATLLKMETFWTQRRKEWNDQSLGFWDVLWNPAFLLKPTDEYNRKLYWRVAVMSAFYTLLLVIIATGIGLALGVWLFPEILQWIRNPRYHKHLTGLLSQEGFYLLPLYPLIILLFSFLFQWPQYYFWNRRAKRLQKEALVHTSPGAMAEILAEDNTTWPPPPQRAV